MSAAKAVCPVRAIAAIHPSSQVRMSFSSNLMRWQGSREAARAAASRVSDYFLSQPDFLSQDAIATLPLEVFSQADIDSVSLSSISLFMQVQYEAMISTVTFLAPALSLTHFATHFASSFVAAKT